MENMETKLAEFKTNYTAKCADWAKSVGMTTSELEAFHDFHIVTLVGSGEKALYADIPNNPPDDFDCTNKLLMVYPHPDAFAYSTAYEDVIALDAEFNQIGVWSGMSHGWT